ncbi:hypothetical protein Pan241w_10930 [Gimesia alba]|uniref:Uncharacterized protein n=1 Tax=Gimesia alba TaxID=2527973 RepID=A0A517RB18_9PLAN|nr:hypothetical protein [Gimesia alba]QDT41034.1 hypothetical protein Pan241w_10930 [Gimesia alba]
MFNKGDRVYVKKTTGGLHFEEMKVVSTEWDGKLLKLANKNHVIEFTKAKDVFAMGDMAEIINEITIATENLKELKRFMLNKVLGDRFGLSIKGVADILKKHGCKANFRALAEYPEGFDLIRVHGDPFDFAISKDRDTVSFYHISASLSLLFTLSDEQLQHVFNEEEIKEWPRWKPAMMEICDRLSINYTKPKYKVAIQ